MLLSCANEKTPISDVKKIEAGVQKKGEVKSELFCLSEFSTYINDYFEARLNKEQLEKFWNCTAKSIAVFKRYAKPNEKGLYPADHVRNFLVAYFWPKEIFNDELLAELMYLKKVLFGGDRDTFSPQDFTLIEKFLENDLKFLTVSLVDDIGTLTSGIINERKAGISEESVNQAIFKFRSVMREFGFVFARHGQPYPFQNIQKLLLGLKPLLVKENDENSIFSRIENFVPIIQETKVLLVGPDRSKILASEWGEFFVLIANAYSVWLRSENFIAGKDFTEGSALSQFHILFDEALTYVQAGISKRLVQVYTYEEAQKWLAAMDKLFKLPLDLNLSILNQYWPWLVDKIFAVDSDDSIVQGLTPKKVAYIQERFTFWYKTQVRINQTWGADFNPKDPRLWNLQRVFENLKMNISFDNIGRIKIPNESHYYDRTSLSYLNLESVAVDLLIRAYANENKRRQETSRLSLSEAETMFSDLHLLLVHFNFIDVEDANFYRRFYRDTSLFLPQSNGDEWVDFDEAVSFLHYVFSGYENSEQMKKQGLDNCLLLITKEKYYKNKCFKEHFSENLNLFTGHLSLLSSYLNKLKSENPQNYEVIIDNLILTVSPQAQEKAYFSSGELLKFHILLQYMETYIFRFDLNGDGSMGPVEVALFLDKYMAPIAMLLGHTDDGFENFIRSFFTYIIKYHKSPLDTGDHGSSLRFHLWSKLQGKWQFKAERLDLSYVLKILGGL